MYALYRTDCTHHGLENNYVNLRKWVQAHIESRSQEFKKRQLLRTEERRAAAGFNGPSNTQVFAKKTQQIVISFLPIMGNAFEATILPSSTIGTRLNLVANQKEKEKERTEKEKAKRTTITSLLVLKAKGKVVLSLLLLEVTEATPEDEPRVLKVSPRVVESNFPDRDLLVLAFVVHCRVANVCFRKRENSPEVDPLLEN